MQGSRQGMEATDGRVVILKYRYDTDLALMGER